MGEVNGKPDAASGQSAGPSAIRALWKFVDGTGPVAYAPDATQTIEAAYSSDPKASVDLAVTGCQCRLDVAKMQQMNIGTAFSGLLLQAPAGETSAIFRDCPNQPDLAEVCRKLVEETFAFHIKAVQMRSQNEKVNAIYNRLGEFKYDAMEKYNAKVILKDMKTFCNGCKYYGFWNSETNSREGKGVQISPYGPRYDGYWKDNKAQGKGRSIRPNGDVYEGCWDQDKANGQGKFTFFDGAIYEGEWLMSKKSGRGVETWADGSKYVGEYLKGEQNGAGVMEWADGRKYDGQWLQGKMHGKGLFRLSDGRVYDGEWDAGKKKGKGTLSSPDGRQYDGEFANDEINGRGTYKWPNDEKYEGTFANGKMHGVGIYEWYSGRQYTGQFVDGEMEGKGTMKWPDGRKYVGPWKQGKRVGKGSMRYADGSEYTGGFLDGNEEGDGILKQPDGREYDVGYRKGSLLYRRIKMNPSSVPSHWEWKDDSGNFVAYSASESQNIENAYLNGDNSIVLILNGHAYSIDVVAMVQTNISSDRTRKIQRATGPPPAIPNSSTTPKSSVQWTFDNDKGFCSYSPTASHTIEEAYQARSAQLTLTTGGHQYVVDLSNMTQTNTATNRVRKIQRSSQAASAVLPAASGCTLEKLPSSSVEYLSVKAEFDKTMAGKYTTLVVIKLTNSMLIGYFTQKESFIQNLHGTAKPIVMSLFHGTRDTNPSAIYNGYYEGFDMQYARDGYWGKGMYFAANANYSHDYAHAEGGMSHIFMAKVIVGNAFDYGVKTNKSLKHPPLLPGDPVKRYDSVKGRTGGSDVYIIYDGAQAYPMYLLSYK